MAKHGKSYLEAAREGRPRDSEYTPAEAVPLVKEPKRAKFDESVEIHVRTGLNVRHADEQLRGTHRAAPRPRQGRQRSPSSPRATRRARPRRPAPTSSAPRTSPTRVQDEGFTDFDVAIATPDMMPVVGRLGRILGPQGKMPNPKVGTVTMDVAQGRRGVQGRQGRVPHRPHRDRAHDRRQDVLRRRRSCSRTTRRSSRSSSARSRRPPRASYLRSIVMASTHGARHQGRPVAHAGPDRGEEAAAAA